MAYWVSQKRRVDLALRNEGFFIVLLYSIMKIETRFNLNDVVWVIFDNMVKKGCISGINLKYSTTEINKMIYVVSIDPTLHCTRTEDQIFTSKEELIKSL